MIIKPKPQDTLYICDLCGRKEFHRYLPSTWRHCIMVVEKSEKELDKEPPGYYDRVKSRREFEVCGECSPTHVKKPFLQKIFRRKVCP